MLDLYKLEIFNSVAIEGSFSKAAKRLLLTQPAVSQHIRDLEISVGTKLFNRTNRGVNLTSAGELLLDYTRCILRLLADAESAVKQLDQMETGQITIGATPGVGVYLLPNWIQDFHQRFPNLAVSLATDTTSKIIENILNQNLDIGFVEGELTIKDPLESMVLRDIELFVVVGKGHELWSKDTITIESLNGQSFVTRPPGSHTRLWTDHFLEQYGLKLKIVAEFDNPEAIRQAVASGLGITILPEWGLIGEKKDAKLRTLPIRGVRLRRNLKLVWDRSQPLKPISKAFLSQLLEEFPHLSKLAASNGDFQIQLPNRTDYKASISACSSSLNGKNESKDPSA